MLRCAQHDRIEITKNPDTGSGLDEVKYGYLLFSHRYAHINLPTMRGLNMMMVVLERGLVHVGQYSMPGWGMSQGISRNFIHKEHDTCAALRLLQCR